MKSLFSGDTIFAGSIGRTDLPGGDMTIFKKTLAGLSELSPELRLYPGHGADDNTEDGTEKQPVPAQS